jgi:hypothetical protein
MTTRARPAWLTALAAFCVIVLGIQVASDLFVEGARDTEVWGGFEVHGAAATATAPLHWALFAAGAWAFWTARPWALTAAAAYLFYVAASHLVWSEASPHGRGWPIGLVQAAVIASIGIVLLRARRRLESLT